MSRFVFINLSARAIEVDVDSVIVGRADHARELAVVFLENNIDPIQDDIYLSSSVDFCEEYGWKEGSVRNIIKRALNIAARDMAFPA